MACPLPGDVYSALNRFLGRKEGGVPGVSFQQPARPGGAFYWVLFGTNMEPMHSKVIWVRPDVTQNLFYIQLDTAS